MFRFYKKRYGEKNRKVVFLLAGWQNPQWHYWLFSKLLQHHGYYCITYTYDKEILDPNPQITTTNTLNVTDDIITESKSLKESGVSEISIFGTSLGSVIAILAANKINYVGKLIINTSGANVARIVWSWDGKLGGFRRKLQKNAIDLNTLDSKWENIHPINNLRNLNNKKILFLTTTNDSIIPQQEIKDLQDGLKKINKSVRIKNSDGWNHFIFGFLNLLNASSIIESF